MTQWGDALPQRIRNDMTDAEPFLAGQVLAAEYIRMSTEHQRYSPDNQRAAIREYAASRGFKVVESYQDSGKSGLTLKGRPALKQMLADVLSADQPYKAILVLDISRWGRFQDTDQSAYYEFMCREAGVAVHYCNEPFDNEGSPLSSIVKHMKRVMAAEYSRELSTRVSRAQRQQARLGFKQGGHPAFATRRQVVDENGVPRIILAAGQRKALSTDKVIYVRGPAKEVALVRNIYRAFVQDRMRLCEIERWLNSRGKVQGNGSAWPTSAVRHLLCDEIYVGQYVFGRRYNNLGRRLDTKSDDWIRVEVMKPLISRALFDAAAARLVETTRRQFSDADLFQGLSRLYRENGYLSRDLVHACPYLPFPPAITTRYGSLALAFASVGYDKPDRWKKNADGVRYSDEDLLNELRRIHAVHWFLSTRVINDDALAPCARYFIRRFGGLTNAFHLAGFSVRPRTQWGNAYLERQDDAYAHALAPRKAPIRRNADGSRITDEQLIADLRRLLAKHGFLSQAVIDADPSIPTNTFFRRRFGGLMAAYARAGYHSTQIMISRAAAQRERDLLPVAE